MRQTTTAILMAVLCGACGSDSPATPDGSEGVLTPDASSGLSADAGATTGSTSSTTGFVPVTTGSMGTTTGLTGGLGTTTGITGGGGMTTTGTGGGTPDAGAADAGGGDAGGTTGSTNPDDEFDEVRQVCVDTINMYRATLDLPPIVRAAHDVEVCSDTGAKKDGDANAAHSSAGSCPGRGSQNTCPGYPVGGFGAATLADSLKGCLAQMWAEDEPPEGREKCLQDYFKGDTKCFLTHGHYLNMSDANVKNVSCGFYDMGGMKKYWMNQDFGR